MTPQQYERLTELFHAALEMAQDEREIFLDQVSKSDAVLWHELKSMLAAHHLEAHTIERPDDIAAALFLAQQHDSTTDRGPLGPNTRLGRFQICSLLGKGGMGEVYLAEDTRLHRYVALKILPAAVASDQDRMRRFEQEAQATAALNHPNIAQIYEIGVADGVNFMAMELIQGVTLRAKIQNERPALRQLLKYLQQVAEGLAKAHAAGVVHRDLKPDNIMITSDDYAKILDFGLAKLIEPAQGKDDLLGEAVTREMRQHSGPGTVMGTVGYMSPEQVQGLSVDQRSDIFAFGCILYESVTGQQPFAGNSPIDSLHKIIYESPPPINSLNIAVPLELQRIVGRCLMKDPGKRYQAIDDVASDLHDLRRKMRSENEEQLPLRSSQRRTSIVSTGKPDHPEITRASISPTTAFDAAQSSAQREAKRHRRATAIILIVLMVVLAVAGYGLFKFTSRKTTPGLLFHEMTMTKLTNGDRTVHAAISPDGKYVAYVLSGSERSGIWLKHLATMSDTQIVPASEALYSAPTFSPDGNYVYYVQSQPNSERGTMYRVGVLGGSSSKMIEDVDPSVLAFSPDGKKLAFLRSSISLMVANADGTDVRTLNRHQGGPWFGTLAWSDNNMVATAVGQYTRESFYMNLSVVSAVNGEEHAISSQWPVISGIASLADGSGLVISAKDQGSGPFQIWQLSTAAGEAHRITNDLNDYVGVSLTKDSSALVTVQVQYTSNIWIVRPGDESSAKQIIAAGYSPSWTPDDKIAYCSRPTGKRELWVAEADGSGQRQISFNANDNWRPIVTPNNRYIVFNFFRDGRPFIGRIDRDGGNLKSLTSDLGGIAPFDISPDSMWVVYNDFTKGGIWKVSIDGGDPMRLKTGYYQEDFAPTISPDGKMIATYNRDRPDGAMRIAIYPFDGGEPVKILQLPWTKDLTQDFMSPLRWTRDGRAVTYISARDDVFNLWNQPLDGSPSKQLTHFTSDKIFWFDWSRDGKRLVLARGTIARNAILIKGNGV